MICRICGQEKVIGQSFNDWVKDTFTNHNLLYPGNIICHDCFFWFDEHSVVLQQKVNKDKPQCMRNYSHFIKNEKWFPYTKANKKEIMQQLIQYPFPELAVIADSGQKHIVFRAKRNQQGQQNGFVQFEEQCFYLNVNEFIFLFELINILYQTFNKDEIKNGNYNNFKKVQEFSFNRLIKTESEIKKYRQTNLFNLCLFLAQKEEKDGGSDNQNIIYSMEGFGQRLQTEVCKNDMGTVRVKFEKQRNDEQGKDFSQLTLF